jgi:hypothetical protein
MDSTVGIRKGTTVGIRKQGQYRRDKKAGAVP